MASEKMDVSSTGASETTSSEAEKTKKIEDHQKILLRGFRLILQQYLQLQEAAEDFGVILPDDVIEMLDQIKARDTAARRQKSGEAPVAAGAVGKAQKGVWDHARTATMIDRALANNIQGVTKKTATLPQGVTLNGIITDAPHMVQGTNFVRSQAIEYDENRKLVGPFDTDKVKQPVEMACKMEWFNLPKGCKLDFGKAEVYPGMKIELGDPVKCGCARETTQAFNRRPMFYKLLEILTMDMDRLGSFLSILVESGKVELSKDGGDLTAIFDDLDDVCSMMCNRIAAMFYLACQNSRGVALESCGFTGFKRNWMRLAHASKVLFEHGVTDLMNMEIKAGRKKFPARRPAPGGDGGGYRGGDSGGYRGGKMGRYDGSGGGHFTDSAYGHSGYTGRF